MNSSSKCSYNNSYNYWKNHIQEKYVPNTRKITENKSLPEGWKRH